MFCIILRETVTRTLALILVGGLIGKLVLTLLNWLIRLVSIKKMVGAFIIHFLLILVLVAFGFFFYWIYQPFFVLGSITDFIHLVFLEILSMIDGCLLISLFEKEEDNKEGEKK